MVAMKLQNYGIRSTNKTAKEQDLNPKKPRVSLTLQQYDSFHIGFLMMFTPDKSSTQSPVLRLGTNFFGPIFSVGD